MSQAEQIDRVVKILAKVPAKKLLLVQLANEMVGADGQLDYEKVSQRQPEVNLAVAEAKIYGAFTEIAVDRLRRLPGVKEAD